MAGAGGNGGVIFGYMVDRNLHSGNIEVTLDENNKISVMDCVNEYNDDIDLNGRVVTMSLQFGHLVVATTHQVQIYDTQNWASPFVIDVKEPISLIVQGAKYMVLIDAANNLNVYNYEGRHISSPKFQGLRVEFLNKNSISVSSDVIGLIDTSNTKIIRIFEVSNGSPTNINIENSNEILAMALNQTEIAKERKLCFIDFNRDMFLTMVNKPEIIKISSMVDSFQWNDNNDMLSAVADGKLHCWFYPNAIYVDRDLMEHSRHSQDATSLGKLAQITNFSGNFVNVTKLDGSNATMSVLPFARILYEHVEQADFEKAIRLCRFVNEKTLWGCLAAMSLYCRELETAEIALAALNEVDKV